jgi:antitoxin component YwqK of YwqJK toxin-antitoxin module
MLVLPMSFLLSCGKEIDSRPVAKITHPHPVPFSLVVQDGKHTVKSRNGMLGYEGIIRNRLAEDYWVFYHENDTVSSSGHFKNGLKQGFWREYWTDGSLKNEYHFNRGILNGYSRSFHHTNFNQPINHQQDKINTKACSVESEGEYVNGKKSGYWKFYYYDSGNLQKQGSYKDDLKNGWWQEYDSIGNLMSEGNYVHNNINGYCKSYQNGILSSEGSYYNNDRRGAWKFYDDKGTLIRIRNYW